MYCISINHKSASVELRRKFAFAPDIQYRFMHDVCSLKDAEQCVILCTCNRTEVYFCGCSSSCNNVQKLLSEYSGVSVQEIVPHIMQFSSDSAIIHLFRVACGIDSMVIGEDEILGQIKNAYISAKEQDTVSYEMNMMFQAAIACAKRVKTNTGLSSRSSVSIATLAANQAASISRKEVKVLLIGASGKTGLTIMKNLLSHKNVKVTVTQRRRGAITEVAEKCGAKIVEYSSRYKYMDDADCVISATSSPHYTVTLNGILDALKTSKKRMFIDLAVPPDIDSEIASIPKAELIGIDCFNKLAKENNELKISSAEAANEMIFEDVETLKRELVFHEYIQYFDQIKTAISKRPVEELFYQLKSQLMHDQLKNVLEAMKNFSEKD